MLLATELKRIFIVKDKGQEVRLTDPEPLWNEQDVMNYYANLYPILTTAKISSRIFTDEAVEYRFESVMGTKG